MSSMQYGVQPTDQDLQAEYETKETSDSHLLLVHIPDGFGKMHISAKVEYDFKRVRVYGERPLENNTKSRFNVGYDVPNYCNIRGIKGKFDGKLVTITMPIDPDKVPKQKPQPKETENEEEDDGDNQSSSKDDDHHDTSPSPTSPQEPVPQKGEDGISHEAPETKVESKPSPSEEESEEEAGQETSTPPEATQESMPEKGKVGISQTDSKLQTEEETCENEEKKQRVVGEEETKDHSLESGMSPEEEDTEKKSKEERKESDRVESSSTKDVDEEKGKERNGEVGSDDDEEKGMPQLESTTTTTRTRIKDVVASASQVVTDIAKRFNEEDKQRIIYMGAAVLVVALGVYATYKLRSSPRP